MIIVTPHFWSPRMQTPLALPNTFSNWKEGGKKIINPNEPMPPPQS